MSEKKSGLFVNLVKKAVGLPTGDSSCCSSTPAETTAQPAATSSCCSTATAKTDEKSASGSTCCG